jgi:gliding motility-associated-like protein
MSFLNFRKVVFIGILFIPSYIWGTPIYVDIESTGNANGESWADAFPDLQQALALAEAGDTIWIAEGVYLPATNDDRTASFIIPGGVAIYGGFNGTETTLEERDWASYPVMLSGDIGVPGDSLDNTYRIIRLIDVNNVSLDGLSIQFANNNLVNPILENRTGGGVYAKNASFALYNVELANNTARYGGAIGLFSGSNCTALNSVFDNNVSNGANNKSGGAIFANSDEEEGYFMNCRFIGNKALYFGGSGGACTGGKNTYLNCIFSSNEAPLGLALSYMEADIYQCSFWRHRGSIGTLSNGNYEVYNSIFWLSEGDASLFEGTATFNDCMISDDECPEGAICNGNMLYGQRPFFVHPSAGDFRLVVCSPAVNAGNNAHLLPEITTDAAGLSRILEGTVDMGAHEMLDLDPDYSSTDVINLRGDFYSRSWAGAIACAELQPGPDTVRFLLGDATPVVIAPLYLLPTLTDGQTIIDATIGYEPGEIIIDGQQALFSSTFFAQVTGGTGLLINGDSIEVYGLGIKNYRTCGIDLSFFSTDARIGLPGKENYFWTDNMQAAPFGHINIGGKRHKIQSNYFGISPSGTIQNAFTDGINLSATSSVLALVEQILVGGKKSLGEGNHFYGCGNAINSASTANIVGLVLKDIDIKGNHFGIDPTTGAIYPNGSVLRMYSFDNTNYMEGLRFGGTLDEGNVVGYSSNAGVWLSGTAHRVAINRNTFICNNWGILPFQNGANMGITPPIINEADIFHLSGVGPPGDTIEVYISENIDCPNVEHCQGTIYFAERVVDDNGEWEVLAQDFPFPLLGEELVTATRTNQYPVTSEFAPCKSVLCPASYSMLEKAICPSDSLVVNGNVYDVDNPSGVETFIDASYLGCDSIVTVALSFYDTPTGTFDTTLCQSQSIQIGDNTFDVDQPSGVATFSGVAANGCDSLVTVNLSFNLNEETFQPVEICAGESFLFQGDTLSSSGTYPYAYPAADGCDSIHYVVLSTIAPVSSNLQSSICPGDSLLFNNQYISSPGTYSDTLAAVNGCDSIITLSLDFLPIASGNLQISICPGDSLLFNNQYISSPGTYSDTLAAVNGCDSIITLSLDFLPIASGNLQISICPGDSLLFNNQYISSPGTYSDTLAAVNGCDSIITLSLDFLPIASGNLQISICPGDSLLFNNQYISSPGTYSDTLAAVNGCDSIITLSLDFLPIASGNLQSSICPGDSLLFNNQYISSPGTYSDTLAAVNGCDSIITLSLDFLPIASGNLQISICPGDSLLFNNQYLSTPGNYLDTLTAVNGCDSVVTLTLTYLPPLQTTISATFCETSTYDFCGMTLDSPGSYECLLTSSTGCDSLVTLQLEAISFTEGFLDTTLCNGEVLNIGNNSFAEAGNYAITLSNSQGCDSILNIQLTYSSIDMPDFVMQPDFGSGDGSIELLLEDSSLLVSWEDLSTAIVREELLAGEYFLQLTDSLGCSALFSIVVEEGAVNFAIPNVFTPNGDGVNDYFNVLSNGSDFNIIACTIYNRWGQLVYDNNTPDTGWDGTLDGKPQPAEVYFYYILISSGDNGQPEQVFQGNVTLLR